MFAKVLQKSWKRLFLVFMVYLLFTSAWFESREVKNVIINKRDSETNRNAEQSLL